jgi:hypothetical protein
VNALTQTVFGVKSKLIHAISGTSELEERRLRLRDKQDRIDELHAANGKSMKHLIELTQALADADRELIVINEQYEKVFSTIRNMCLSRLEHSPEDGLAQEIVEMIDQEIESCQKMAAGANGPTTSCRN